MKKEKREGMYKLQSTGSRKRGKRAIKGEKCKRFNDEKKRCPLHIKSSVIAMTRVAFITRHCRGSFQSSLSLRRPEPHYFPIFRNSLSAKHIYFSPIYKTYCKSESALGYEGLGALHCFCFFFPKLHRH
ncbi:hypothetical protein XENORESO_020046 [Xenotaenia resolanae]|uniref:Uncharacterized protein n=1 Tax=Xenotaenia resolanae TaxID=208358 RepID=A0ABV0WH74_9TELE